MVKTWSERLEERRRVGAGVEELLALGLRVIPVHHPWSGKPRWARDWNERQHRGKRPLVRWKGLNKGGLELARIRSWFTGGGSWLVNAAVLTGRGWGFVVIDVDSEAALEWGMAKLPTTPMVTLTSEKGRFRGEHWYYRVGEGMGRIGNRVKIRVDGDRIIDLDVRGDGGNAVAPGSRHASGIIYQQRERWTPALLEAVPMLDFLEMLGRRRPAPLEVRDSAGDAFERAKRWMAKRDRAVAGQGGDAFTYSTACFLVGNFGLTDGEAYSLLEVWNEGNLPPWSPRELLEKIRNARAYGQCSG
jgi:hypothetical protein